jgi:uncharacterized protein (TIGR03032 family)
MKNHKSRCQKEIKYIDNKSTSESLKLAHSSSFNYWLNSQNISLALTTYQTNRLMLLGINDRGECSMFERYFERAMGMYASIDHLYLGTRYQLWQFDNDLAQGDTYKGFDQVYLPRMGMTTGDLDIHDLVVLKEQSPTFINTRYSCLATLGNHCSFQPIWKPQFISKLAPEDRCHLNGLAVRDNEPRYVSSCSRSDVSDGWRDKRKDGGVIIDIKTDEIVATGLSMPHSPRWYNNKLWVLNSGKGEFGYIDLETQQFEPVAFCPGYARGLAFWENYALVGLSKPRNGDLTFSGLELDRRLTAKDTVPRCGLLVIDLENGNIVSWVRIEGLITELYDVQVIPGVKRPMALGFKTDEIAQWISFKENNQIQHHYLGSTQTSQNHLISQQPLQKLEVECRGLKMSVENSLNYETLTFPNIRKRWSRRQPQGELLAVIAEISEQPVGLVIAELISNVVEIISFYVLPEYRQKGIGKALVKNLESGLISLGCQSLKINYKSTELTQIALEPLLKSLDWQSPQIDFVLGKSTIEKMSQAPWLKKYPLPGQFIVFPWSELTDEDRKQITQMDYPTALNPFNSNSFESINSLGLRYQEQMVGWIITHRVAEDSIRYSSLFVDQPFQKMGRGIALLSQSILSQIATTVPRCLFAVPTENQEMLGFVTRRLQPYLTQLSDSRISLKSLQYNS